MYFFLLNRTFLIAKLAIEYYMYLSHAKLVTLLHAASSLLNHNIIYSRINVNLLYKTYVLYPHTWFKQILICYQLARWHVSLNKHMFGV